MIRRPPRSTLFPTRRSSDLRRDRRSGCLSHRQQHEHRDCQSELHAPRGRSEEHTSELQSRRDLVCRLLLEKKKTRKEHTAQKESTRNTTTTHSNCALISGET